MKGKSAMMINDTNSGIAALTIIEALLLALNDADILPEKEIVGVLSDAATSHEKAAVGGVNGERHAAVAALINRIIAGGNSVRRP
jgi:hypothetical protein